MSDDNQQRRKLPGRRPLSEGSADDTRRSIRLHALRLFNERGYAAVSIDDIALTAGLTRATLYYHYRSKAEILVRSVVATVEIVSAEVQAIAGQQQLSVRERLERILQRRREPVSTWERSQAAPEVVNESMVIEAMPHLSPGQQQELSACFDEVRRLMLALMAEGVQRGELRDISPEILEYVFEKIFEPTAYTPLTLEERTGLEKTLLEVFLRGTMR